MTSVNRLPTTGAPRLTRRKLRHLQRESIHQARNWSKADVSIAEWPPKSGNRVVVKELKNRPLWFRVLAGRYLLRREWQALYALRDLEGVPAPVARPDRDTIVMAYHEGQPLDKLPWWETPEDVVEKIEGLLAQVHARGITHGDLHGYNVLVAENGAIALIDWATASSFSRRRGIAKSFTFDEWRALDERALAKIKIVHAPDQITPTQHDLLLHGGSRIYRLVKQLKGLGERIRGVDEATVAARQNKQSRILKRLEKFSPQRDEQEKALLQARRLETKKQKKEASCRAKEEITK